MGIRETLNKNQKLVTLGTIGLIVLALAVIVWQMLPESGMAPPTQAYYTIDDGNSYFVDDIAKVVPFTKDGKEAVRAHVFKCEGSSQLFVGYLERFTPQAKAALEAFYNNPQNKGRVLPSRMEIEEQGRMVKRPKMPGWVPTMQYNIARPIMQEIKCPDGSYAREVFPGEK